MCEMLVVEIYGSDSNEKAVDHIRVTSTSDFSIGYLERAAGGGARLSWRPGGGRGVELRDIGGTRWGY